MTEKNGETPEKNKGGRPPIWTDPIELKQLVFDYFNEEKKPTLAGLAVALGISRSTLYNYEKKDKFLDIIKKARERVERIYEQRLIYSERPTGVIFALKNMGWADRRETDITSGGEKLSIGVVSYKKKKEEKVPDPDNKPVEQVPVKVNQGESTGG